MLQPVTQSAAEAHAELADVNVNMVLARRTIGDAIAQTQVEKKPVRFACVMPLIRLEG